MITSNGADSSMRNFLRSLTQHKEPILETLVDMEIHIKCKTTASKTTKFLKLTCVRHVGP